MHATELLNSWLTCKQTASQLKGQRLPGKFMLGYIINCGSKSQNLPEHGGAKFLVFKVKMSTNTMKYYIPALYFPSSSPKPSLFGHLTPPFKHIPSQGFMVTSSKPIPLLPLSLFLQVSSSTLPWQISTLRHF